ncbi:condensation domain-containing protein [Kitasatospora purpeofusca]|uniref:condensation domain-containing protein n=1 Tax=Kitasatospora purpeofusca TaxID=67352 RepID=UPI0038602D50
MGDEAHYFNVRRLIDLPAGTSVDTAVRAIGELLVRHEALRTGWAAGGAEPEQTVRAEGAVEVLVVPAPEGDVREVAQARTAAQAAEPLPGADGMPGRFTVFARGAEAVCVGAVVTHQAVDGWSMRVLERELRALAATALAGHCATSASTVLLEATAAVGRTRSSKLSVCSSASDVSLPVARSLPVTMVIESRKAAVARAVASRSKPRRASTTPRRSQAGSNSPRAAWATAACRWTWASRWSSAAYFNALPSRGRVLSRQPRWAAAHRARARWWVMRMPVRARNAAAGSVRALVVSTAARSQRWMSR